MQNETMNRVELHQFARDAGLTPEQVTDELASGRLAFAVDDKGVVHTDRFAVLDWCHRRINAIATFGADNVGFPMHKLDWRAVEDIPDRREVEA